MYNGLRELGIPHKLIKLVEMTLNDSQAKVIIHGNETNAFYINGGVRQGDALSALLFNLTLEKIIRNIDVSKSICNKMTQINGYADDIVIVSRSKNELKSVFLVLENQAKKMGLEVNVQKTKYMIVTKRTNIQLQDLEINEYSFEHVREFIYLGSQVNSNNDVTQEIQRRIKAGMRSYYANKSIMTSKCLSKKSKLRIYQSMIKPVITYGCETWPTTEKIEEQLRMCERKILRRIYGPTRNEDGTYRIKMNHELNNIIEGKDIVRYIKAQRIAWLGHIRRMNEERRTRVITQWKPAGKRLAGRPKKRWYDCVLNDLRIMGVRNWWRVTEERKEWKKIIEQAKTHPGL